MGQQSSKNPHDSKNAKVTDYETKIQILLVGDKASRKDEMLASIVKKDEKQGGSIWNSDSSVAQMFATCEKTRIVDNVRYTLNVKDSDKGSDFEGFGNMAYKNADVFFLCFSLKNEKSFNNVKKKWMKEIEEFAKTKPLILVGTELGGERSISDEQVDEMMKDLNCCDKCLCSVTGKEQLDELVDSSIISYLAYQRMYASKTDE